MSARAWVVLVCMLVACGADDDPETEASTTEASTTGLSSGTTAGAPPAGADARAEELASRRADWMAAGIETYDFTLQYTTMYRFGTYRISVIEGEPVSAERAEPGEISDYLDVPELPKTIDEVFDQLELELAAPTFDVQFDTEYGYPAHAFIDAIEGVVDDETEFYITDFVVPAGEG